MIDWTVEGARPGGTPIDVFLAYLEACGPGALGFSRITFGFAVFGTGAIVAVLAIRTVRRRTPMGAVVDGDAGSKSTVITLRLADDADLVAGLVDIFGGAHIVTGTGILDVHFVLVVAAAGDQA